MTPKPLNFVELDVAIAAANAIPLFPGYRFSPGDIVDLARWDRYKKRDHDESIALYDAFGICTVVSSRRACSESGAMVTVVNQHRREIELDQNWMQPAIEI